MGKPLGDRRFKECFQLGHGGFVVDIFDAAKFVAFSGAGRFI